MENGEGINKYEIAIKTFHNAAKYCIFQELLGDSGSTFIRGKFFSK
jgi:hypothetical protein